MSGAYACRISREHFGPIASEKPNFSREDLEKWLEEHEGGFFIRDEESPWDCSYMADVVFHQIYSFERFNSNDIFHRVIRL